MMAQNTADKLRVLIVEDSEVTALSLRAMIEAQDDMTVAGIAATGQEGMRRASELYPDVTLMDIHLPDIDGTEATWLLTAKAPDTAVIMVSSEGGTEYVQRAMLAGAQGYIVKPVREPTELANTIRTVHQRSQQRRAQQGRSSSVPQASIGALQRGHRVAVFSPKGGQGKTTIAVNLAVVLRALTEKRVALVDADLRFGDANLLLDLPFERSLVDLLPRIDELDSDLLDQVLSKHASGVEVLVRPERPELAETISARHIEQVLTVLPRLFEFVVIDCDVSYEEKLLAVLDRADSILLIVTPDLGAMRNTRHFLHLAQKLGYPQSKLNFVVNRANSKVGLTVGDVERTLGPGKYFQLGSYGRTLTTSRNMGRPAVVSQPRSEFARVIRRIAEHLRHTANGAT
jgi:pilus assembly protein CpaE